MASKVLPEWQKDIIMQVMSNRGLNTSEFQWIEASSGIDSNSTISKLVHSATGYYFSFDFLNDLHYNERHPGVNSETDTSSKLETAILSCRALRENTNGSKILLLRAPGNIAFTEELI
jgi:hypothetical protein